MTLALVTMANTKWHIRQEFLLGPRNTIEQPRLAIIMPVITLDIQCKGRNMNQVNWSGVC